VAGHQREPIAPGAAGRGSVPYFDSVAERYHERYAEQSADGYAIRRRRQRLLEFLGGCRGRVLDVGCGPGVLAADLLARGCEFLGVDGSARMIAECKRRFRGEPRARFAVADAMALPFRDASFDAVTSTGVIDRVLRPERAIAEMGRVLRPGGILILSLPNLLSPYGFWRSHVVYRAAGLWKRVAGALAAGPRRPHLASAATLWTPRRALRTVEELVGDVDGAAYYHFGLLPFPLDARLPALALRLAPRAERLADGPLRWLGAGLLVKARKRA
jgi:ubiquinone/menaquinone biosynthesis C-methylase UbiE